MGIWRNCLHFSYKFGCFFMVLGCLAVVLHSDVESTAKSTSFLRNLSTNECGTFRKRSIFKSMFPALEPTVRGRLIFVIAYQNRNRHKKLAKCESFVKKAFLEELNAHVD